jgi:hypothetical protein
MGQSRKGAEYLSEGLINFLCTPDQKPSCVHKKAALHMTGAMQIFERTEKAKA